MTHTLTAAQHAAMEGEAPFPLPDQVVISGRKVAGTCARVYSLLRTTAEKRICHRIGAQIGPAGWVPNYYFRKAWSGGNAGDRRMRDLREKHGVELESTRFSGDSSVVLFRWVSDSNPASSSPQAENGVSLSSRNGAGKLPIGSSFDYGQFPATSGQVEPSEASERLRFWTSIGYPGSDAPGRVQVFGGGELALDFPNRIFAEVVRGGISRESALRAYDLRLKSRWPEIRSWLAGGGDWVLWVGPEVAEVLDPLPLLVEILGKCGAAYQGQWNESTSQAGVA